MLSRIDQPHCKYGNFVYPVNWCSGYITYCLSYRMQETNNPSILLQTGKSFCLLYRRALDYIMFTSDQVHLLPGFPDQDGYPQRIRVALYVQLPPGVADVSSSTLNKNVLLTVISESRENLENALNATIVSIKVAFVDVSTESSSTVTPPAHIEETSEVYFIIGGAVAGLILVIILSVLICRK